MFTRAYVCSSGTKRTSLKNAPRTAFDPICDIESIWPPLQSVSRAGQEHGRTIRLADIGLFAQHPLKFNRTARDCNRRCDLVLCDDFFKLCIILQQAVTGEGEEVITKFRILKVNLQQLIIPNC